MMLRDPLSGIWRCMGSEQDRCMKHSHSQYHRYLVPGDRFISLWSTSPFSVFVAKKWVSSARMHNMAASFWTIVVCSRSREIGVSRIFHRGLIGDGSRVCLDLQVVVLRRLEDKERRRGTARLSTVTGSRRTPDSMMMQAVPFVWIVS